jgi:hypothetical protein
MPKYQFTVDITSAEGSQTFEATADSPAEALDQIKNGGGEIVQSDVEVQGLAWHTATLTNEEPDTLAPTSDNEMTIEDAETPLWAEARLREQLRRNEISGERFGDNAEEVRVLLAELRRLREIAQKIP